MTKPAHAEPETVDSGIESSGPLFWQSRRFWAWVVGVTLALLLCAGLAAAYFIRNAEPILRARIIETLSARFRTKVQLSALHLAFSNGVGLHGEGLVVPGIGEASEGSPPLLRVNSFTFHAGLDSLFKSPAHISTVYVQGMDINLPPKGQRPRFNAKAHYGKISLVFEKIVCADAKLVLGTNKPNKNPLEFDISRLVLTNVAPGQPFHFVANLTNPKPIGDIASTGDFGPFRSDSPADTPVRGHYSFSNADLSTTKGISGILSSTGDYSGELSNIIVDGQTQTPDFALDIANHRVPLNTTFHAIVDGASGDVALQPVKAKLLNSSFVASGSVTGTKGIPGRDIELQVSMDQAHIQNFLQLAFKTSPPLMSGQLAMKAKLSIPPGSEPVPQKIRLQGRFTISGATFSNSATQQKIDMFSMRAEGHAKEAKSASGDDKTESAMSGDFKSGNGVMDISNLRYELPGAQVALDGKYTMDGNTFDFRGVVRTKAALSQMTTGWKSLLLKPVDPFFHKRGAGAQIPVKITGTKSEPHFGLDLHDEKNRQHPSDPVPQ